LEQHIQLLSEVVAHLAHLVETQVLLLAGHYLYQVQEVAWAAVNMAQAQLVMMVRMVDLVAALVFTVAQRKKVLEWPAPQDKDTTVARMPQALLMVLVAVAEQVQ
jgi:hypothetical protein